MRRQWEILEAGGRHILLAAEDGGRLVGSVMGVVCEELYGDGRRSWSWKTSSWTKDSAGRGPAGCCCAN